ncbi:YjcZ family sporulation protein [Paenibacillus sp. MBLB4367]
MSEIAEVRGYGNRGFTSTGVILVLFILLVIVACACVSSWC